MIYLCIMIIDGRKYTHVLSVGTYNGFVFTPEDVSNIAKYYNPNFREAAIWKGHHASSHVGKDEQEALGWIYPVLAMDGKLYIAFSYMSSELIDLIAKLKYKYVSVEIMYYKLMDEAETIIPYLSGVGLTNRPAVEGLEPLTFVSEDQGHSIKFNSMPANAVTGSPQMTGKFDNARVVKFVQFTLEINSNNQNQNEMLLTETTKKSLTAVGLDPVKFVTEEAAQEAIVKTLNDTKAEVTALTTKVTELTPKKPAAGSDNTDPKVTALEAQVKQLTEQSAVNLVDRAITDKKILAKDRQSYIDVATANLAVHKNLTAIEALFTSMPVNPALVGKQVNDNGKTFDLTDPKFIKADGKALTYSEISKKPSLISKHKLTEEDIQSLKEME